MPKILEAAVKEMKKKGMDEKKAYAIAVSSLQRAGDLKKGSTKATAKGLKRGNMTKKQRAKTRGK